MSVVKKAILQAMIEGVLTDLMVKTQADMVYLEDTVTVASKIAEMVTAINERAKTSDVTAQITQAINDLKGGASAAYDTLVELENAIKNSDNAELLETLNQAIGNKADKTTVQNLSQTVENLTATVNSKSTVHVGASTPANFGAGDLFIKLV